MRHLGRTGRRRRHRHTQYDVTCPCHKVKVEPVDASSDEDVVNLKKWMKADGFRAKTLRPAVFPETGRGLMTTRKLGAGALVVAIPVSLLITTHTVLGSHLGSYLKRWESLFTAVQWLSIFLIYEKHKRDSRWTPYIAVIPKTYTNAAYWTHNELQQLPQHVREKVEEQIAQLNESYQEIVPFCAYYESQNEALVGCMTWEAYRWAWSSVNTRCVYMKQSSNQWLRDPEQDNMALVPFLDLLNHSADVQVEAGFNESTAHYEIHTLTPCSKYDQVFISYGPHDNARLLVEYGFVVPGNQQNTLPVSLDNLLDVCHALGIRDLDDKVAIIKEKELHRGMLLSSEGLSWNLEAALRILALSKNERIYVHQVTNGLVVSKENEVIKKRIAHKLLQETTRDLKQLDKIKTDGLNIKEEMSKSLRAEYLEIVSLNKVKLKESDL